VIEVDGNRVLQAGHERPDDSAMNIDRSQFIPEIIIPEIIGFMKKKILTDLMGSLLF